MEQKKYDIRRSFGLILLAIFLVSFIMDINKPYLGFLPLADTDAFIYDAGKLLTLVFGLILVSPTKPHFNDKDLGLKKFK